MEEWNQRYRSGETAATTKMFYPDAIEAYREIRKLEHTALQTQILTGHGGFSKYLHRFKCKEDPSCACEPGTEETVEHVLFECPITKRKRMETEHEINHDITKENANRLVKDGKINEAFLNYCKYATKQVINRNKDK
ncbi:jg2172 [Pararge aegeria aegeria]|uniref:Jg2172 protein n=1 Tax=Pararge aegeria aegeria TaxID=348720 RepID=A0A8S4QND2_9NEOP|nr:jg2172 [Pararge aegeria aegeria]